MNRAWLLLSLVVASWALPALAIVTVKDMIDAGGFLLPPARYDHRPISPVKIDTVDGPLFDLACGTLPERIVLGCYRKPFIFVRTDLTPQARAQVLRHEYAHVNGWPRDHPDGVPLR